MNRKPLIPGSIIELEGNTVRIDHEVGRGGSAVVYMGEIIRETDMPPMKVIIKEFYPRNGFRRVNTKLEHVSVEQQSPDFWNKKELFKVGYRKQTEMGNSSLMEIAVKPYLYGAYGESEYYLCNIHLGKSLDQVQFDTLQEKLDCMIRVSEVFGILHNNVLRQNEKRYVMLDFSPSNILWIENPKGVKILDADSIVPYEINGIEDLDGLQVVGIGDNRYASPGIRQMKKNMDTGLTTLEKELPFYGKPRENVYGLGCWFFEILFGRFPSKTDQAGISEELCKELFTKYEAEFGNLKNAEELLKIIIKAIQLRPRDRYKDAFVMLQKLNAVSKKISAYEHIPKYIISQANGTFLSYNLLEKYPLFEYISEYDEKDKRKQIFVTVTGGHKIRKNLISAILCMQMLNTELVINIVEEKAEYFWQTYLEENPAVRQSVTWSVNGKMESDVIDTKLVTEKLAHINLIKKRADEPFPEAALKKVRYFVILDEITEENQKRLNHLAVRLADRTEKVLVSCLQNDWETEPDTKCFDWKHITVDIMNNQKFTEAYNENMFSEKLFKMALCTHAYYKGYMNADTSSDMAELEKELRNSPYHMESSQRTGLHSIYKLASVGIKRSSLGKFLKYYRLLQDEKILEQLAWLEHRSWIAFMITKGAVPLSYNEFLQIAYQKGNTWKDLTTNPEHIRHPLLTASYVGAEQTLSGIHSVQNEELSLEINKMDLLDQMGYRIARWYLDNRDRFQFRLDENIVKLKKLLHDGNILNEKEMAECISSLEKEGKEVIAHIGERLSNQNRKYVEKWEEVFWKAKNNCNDEVMYNILMTIEQDIKPVIDSYSERNVKQLDRDLVFAVMDLLGI